MAESKEFRDWNHAEARRIMGVDAAINEKVDREMRRIRVEVKNDKGLWEEVNKDDPLSDHT